MHNGVADPSRNPQGGGSCQAETGLAAYAVTVARCGWLAYLKQTHMSDQRLSLHSLPGL